MRYLGLVAGRVRGKTTGVFGSSVAREAAVFAAVVALLVDIAFLVALSNAQLAGGPLQVWGAVKALVVVIALGWVAVDRSEWSLALIAAIFALVGLEDAFGVTAPLGLWLIEEAGVRRGPQGSNAQILSRALVSLAFLGPTVYLAGRAKAEVQRAVWGFVALLVVIFVAAVLGDLVTDRTGNNLDELVEEPILSLAAAFAIGLAVDWAQRR